MSQLCYFTYYRSEYIQSAFELNKLAFVLSIFWVVHSEITLWTSALSLFLFQHQNLAWCLAVTMGKAGAWKRVRGFSLLILIVVYLLSTFLAFFGTGMLVGVFTRACTEPCPEFSPKVQYSLPPLYQYFHLSVIITFSTLSFPIRMTH